MYRLFPCIPIFRGFLLKVQKKCLYVIMLKIALVLVKIYALVGKKGISELSCGLAQKHTVVNHCGICHTSWLPKFGHQMLNCPSIKYIVPVKIFAALQLC